MKETNYYYYYNKVRGDVYMTQYIAELSNELVEITKEEYEGLLLKILKDINEISEPLIQTLLDEGEVSIVDPIVAKKMAERLLLDFREHLFSKSITLEKMFNGTLIYKLNK